MLTAMVARERPTDRRREFSAQTRQRLVDEATELFARQGYAGTSLDEVVSAANVTKGALYHHFSSKLALFAAVFDETQARRWRRSLLLPASTTTPGSAPGSAVRTFTVICREPRFRRIVMQEGPVALGFERFREADEANTYGLIRDIVSSVLTPYDVPSSILDTFTRVFYGAMSAAGMSVAESADPEAAGREVEVVIGLVLAGLRQLADSGDDFPALTD